MTKIETERLILKRFEASDWADLHAYLSDEKVVQYEPYGVYTVEQAKKEAISRSEQSTFLGIYLKDTQRLIGNIYFAKKEFKTWEIGYILNASYQREGYALEATKAVLVYGFKVRGARRIIATCDSENERSWLLLEKLGMRREGHAKQDRYGGKNIHGEIAWRDTYMYAILRDEWEG